MAQKKCPDCPPNCVNLEFFTQCGQYTGDDIPSKNIICGDSLNDVILKLAGEEVPVETPNPTSDDIKSMASSFTAGGNSLCVLSITKRDFTYDLTVTANSTVFTYDFSDAISSLPAGYVVGSVNVTATGKKVISSTLLGSSRSEAGGFDFNVDRYPVTIMIEIRVQTPCGDVVMSQDIYIPSPSSAGTFRKNFEVTDFSAVTPSDLNLTEHLKSIESNIHYTKNRVDSLFGVELGGQTNDIRTIVQGQETRISELENTISSPTNFVVNYENNGNYSIALGSIISDLYDQIRTLEDKNRTLELKLQSLT